MKRAPALLRPHAGIASVLLTLCLILLAGCSGCSSSDATSTAARPLDESEIEAIKQQTAKTGERFHRLI